MKTLLIKLIADLREEDATDAAQQLLDLNTASLSKALARALQTRAETASAVYVVIGGLDELETLSGGGSSSSGRGGGNTSNANTNVNADWGWLPTPLPANVRLIVAAANTSALRSLKRKLGSGVKTLKMPAPSRALSAQHLAQYFSQHSDANGSRVAVVSPMEVANCLAEVKEKRYGGLMTVTICPGAERCV